MKNVKRVTRAKFNQIESRKEQLTIPGTNTDLSNACDDFIEARDAFLRRTKEIKEDKDAVTVSNERVAEIMVRLGMETCKHGGLTFRVKEAKEVKPKVVVKAE